MPQHTSNAKEAALLAVGRTVANFQRLEQSLKLAARLRPLDGAISKIRRDVERTAERAATMTLGQAIQAWLTTIDGETVVAPNTPDLFEVTMQMTFSLGIDADSVSAHGGALKSLLEIRNNLIHKDLALFQWDSADECDRLKAKLERVIEDIRVQKEFVDSIVIAANSMLLEHAKIAEAEILSQLGIAEKATHDA
jgi:hypothetical protein